MDNLFRALEYIINIILLLFYSLSILKSILLKDYTLKYEWINIFLIIGKNITKHLNFPKYPFSQKKQVKRNSICFPKQFYLLPSHNTGLKLMLKSENTEHWFKSHKIYGLVLALPLANG